MLARSSLCCRCLYSRHPSHPQKSESSVQHRTAEHRARGSVQLITRLHPKEKRNPLLIKKGGEGIKVLHKSRDLCSSTVPLLGKFMGTSKIRGTGVLSTMRLYFKSPTVHLFILDLRKNCVGRSSGRVSALVSGKLLMGFTKYFHGELRWWRR